MLVIDDWFGRINCNFCLRLSNQINRFEEEAELSAAWQELSNAHGKAWESFCFHFFVWGWPCKSMRWRNDQLLATACGGKCFLVRRGADAATGVRKASCGGLFLPPPRQLYWVRRIKEGPQARLALAAAKAEGFHPCPWPGRRGGPLRHEVDYTWNYKS